MSVDHVVGRGPGTCRQDKFGERGPRGGQGPSDLQKKWGNAAARVQIKEAARGRVT